MIDETLSEKIDQFLLLRLSASQVRRALIDTGYGLETIHLAMTEYDRRIELLKVQTRRTKRLIGWLVFFGFGSAFLYFVMLASTTHYLFVWPLLAASMWGLFRGLMPPSR